MTCFVLRMGGLALVLVTGCSSTAIGVTHYDAGAVEVEERDAGPPPSIDAGIDAGAPDAGSVLAPRCFEDVELVTLFGGRMNVESIGLHAIESGWLVIYDAFSHGNPGGRFVTFIDHEGRVTSTRMLGAGEVPGATVMLGPYLLSWLYDSMQWFEVRADELVARPDLSTALPPSRIVAVDAERDRLRVLSQTWADPAADDFRFSYSEIVLGEDGGLSVAGGALPPAAALGAPGLLDGLRRYYQPVFLSIRGDAIAFAFEADEPPTRTDQRVWNATRITLDRSALSSGVVGWTLLEERRWADGPSQLFGALPDLDLAVTGRFLFLGGHDYEGSIAVERFASSESTPPIVLEAMSDEVGRTTYVARRGDFVGVSTLGRFRVLSVPDFEERASAPAGPGLPAWGDDRIAELIAVATEDRLVALVRCHLLVPTP